MKQLILIGTGPMAVDYTRVLQAMNINFSVVGRGASSARSFKEKTGVNAYIGGVESYLADQHMEYGFSAIIATGAESLMSTLQTVLNAGAANILIEKPGAISIAELIASEQQLKPHEGKIFVAYNRRFYASVREAFRLINEDGGLKSMHFEFTEWAHKIEPLQKAPGVKENWFFANSTHVVDLAFFFAGIPSSWETFYKTGGISWHTYTNFAGAGITNKGVLFSYISNWESAGRWAIELLTDKRRIYLKPLEGIAVQPKGSIAVDKHTFDDSLDMAFKPGLYRQVKAFLDQDTKDMIDMTAHIRMSRDIYARIIGLKQNGEPV